MISLPFPGAAVAQIDGQWMVVGNRELPLGSTRLFWEGGSSKATFSANRIVFKLDVIGPDWLFVDLHNAARGVELSCWRTGSDTSNRYWTDTRTCPTVAALLDDPEYGQCVGCLLKRSAIRLSPDVTLNQPYRPQIVASLIHDLDGDFSQRRQAIRQLQTIDNLERAYELDLTVNQRAMIEAILSD